MVESGAKLLFMLKWIGVPGVLLCVLGTVGLALAAEDGSALAEGAERVLFLPLAGEDAESIRLKEKEAPGTARFLKSRGWVQTPALLPVTSKEVYQQVEPALAIAMRQEACQGREQTRPAESLAQAQSRMLDGDLDGARKWLDQVRQELPCSVNRLSRSQMSELFLWSGMVHPDWPGEDALAWIRTGLGVDPAQANNPRLPTERQEVIEQVAGELDRDYPRVDLHMPEDEGSLWSLKNLALDGRRLVFEKLFVQLIPGHHYLQLTLPNEQTWGTFLTIEPGTRPDLAAEVRRALGLGKRFDKEIHQLLYEGYASPALSDGLKRYLEKIRRDRVVFTGLSREEDGSYMTVRQFSISGKVNVAHVSSETGEAVEASTKVVLSQPFEGESGLRISSIRAPELTYVGDVEGLTGGYRAPSVGLELGVWRVLGPSVQLGGSLTFGLRAFPIVGVEGVNDGVLGLDLEPAVGLRTHFALGPVLRATPEVGYRLHGVAYRGLPLYCSGIPSADATSGLPAYACGKTWMEDPEALLMNVRGVPHGPYVRVGIELKPFFRGLVTLRTQARLGYSPLFVSLDERIPVTLTTRDTSGVIAEEAMLLVDEDSRSLMLHQVDVLFGLNGVY